jgi:hypothetical protein
MKYLVVKGWLGFGDRLESLKMCVAYAIEHNLQIYVDWTDSIWSHGNESFYTYFNLVNMPILNSLDDIPDDATYYPDYWKGNIKTPFSQELFDKQKELGLNVGMLGPSTPTHADVLVHSSFSNRSLYADSTFFANVFRVIDPRIRVPVIQRKIQNNLASSLGFHIRGTDRTRNRTRLEMSVQFMALNAVSHGAFSGQSMIAVGDDAYSIEIWKRYFPHTVVFSKLVLANTSAKGNHNASKEELSTSKDNMNVEMLIDFFTLASCSRIISTFKDSRFAAEARRLHPVVGRIIGNE